MTDQPLPEEIELEEHLGPLPSKETLLSLRGINIFDKFDSFEDLVLHVKNYENKRMLEGNDHKFLWFDLYKPTKEILEKAEELFRVYPVTIDSILDKLTLTDEVVQFPHYIYLTFCEDIDDNSDDYIKILISKYWLVTIHDHEIRDANQVLEKIKNFTELDPYQVIPAPDWILYSFIDLMVDQYLPRCDQVLDEAENCDELVFQLDLKELNELLERIELARRSCSNIHRMLQSKQKVIAHLAQYSTKILSFPVQSKLNDLLDNLDLGMIKLESTKETLFQAHYNYLSRTMVEIVESSDVSDRYLNIIMILSLLMVPFQTVSTLFGMNVPVPFGTIENNLGPWFGIFTVEIIASIVLIVGSLILLRIFDRWSTRSK